MRFYLDRGHRPEGGAAGEWEQSGVFVEALFELLMAAGADVVRTPDEIDSFEGQDWAIDDLAADHALNPDLQALFLACHVDVGSSEGHVFWSSDHGRQWAELIAAAMPYRTEALSTATPGYPRTGSCLARITESPLRICGCLLELWRTSPRPTDAAILEVAEAVASALR